HGLVFDRDHQPFGVDVGDYMRTCLVAVQAAVGLRYQVDHVNVIGWRRRAAAGDFVGLRRRLGVGRAVIAQVGLVVHEPVHGDAVALGDFVVVEVVGAGNLDRAGAEFRVRVLVGDYRYQAPVCFRANRYFTTLADNRRITGIVGMYGDGTVTEHGFRTRGGDGDVVAGFPQRDIAVGVGFGVFVGFAVGQ